MVSDKKQCLYWIYNPKWRVVLRWYFDNKKACIEKFTWWNTIQWKWKPSQWWKCLKMYY